MRKLLLPAVLFVCFPLAASAQIIPRVALFGGYTYVHARFNSPSGPSFNLNGWDASLEGRMASWLGVIADVSQQYGTPSGIQERQTTALFGPQLSVPGIPRVIPFAHALVGIVHGTNQVSTGPAVPAISGGNVFPGITTGNAFATAVGGGIDIKVLGPLWIRAVQADWLHGNLSPDHHTQVRLSTGIVIRL